MFRALPFVAALLFTTSLAAQEGRLAVGGSVRGSVAPGDTVVHTVGAGADYLVRGWVHQVSADVAIRVLDPDGEQVLRVAGAERGDDLFQFETEEAGVHRIQLVPEGDESGEYILTLVRLEELSSDPATLADQLLSVYDREDAPGVAVAVWRDGKTLYERAYGMANLTHDVPFEVDTPTNIGSTSKQFTGFAVMLLVDRGEISLDDDVREYLPELPEFDETVTVRNLLTHTTGYREFINLNLMSGFRLEHGDYFDRANLIAVIQRQAALQNEPDSEFNYNNTAFGLAAQIVERVSGQAFDEFLDENVFEPLGMSRTQVRMTSEQIVPGRAMGYLPTPDGEFREATDAWGSVGAGGIYSTVGDLQKWAENYTRADVGNGEIIRQMTTPHVLANGDTTGYGFGIFIDEYRGLRRLNHGGNDLAHTSQFHFFPGIDAGVTIQTNYGGFQVPRATRLIDAFFADALGPEEEDGETVAGASEFDAATYDPEDFDEFTGRYALDAAPQFILTVSRSADSLLVQATGQPRLEVLPTSDSTFAMTSIDGAVTFLRGDEGEVEGLTLQQQGQTMRATRLDEQEWEPTVAELRDYEGRYYSEEIETFYTLEVEDEALQFRQRRMESGALTPREKDVFSGVGFQFSFQRDPSGQLTAVLVSNGRTRDVRFERLR